MKPNDTLSKMDLKEMLDVLETNGKFIKNILDQYSESEVEENKEDIKSERDNLHVSEQEEAKTDEQLYIELETEAKQNDSAAKKKLFSYNPLKNPKVDCFFNVIDNGMHSFYIRKAIEFYVDNSSKFKKL